MGLDAVDVKIINMLIENGRVSYTDISKEVGMKLPSIIDRIKRLESNGIITGYSTKINHRKLDYDISAFIGVSIDNPMHLEDFNNEVSLIDDVIECYHITGEYSLLVKIIAKNTTELAVIIKKIRALTGVVNTNTMLVFSTLLNREHRV